MACVGVCNTYTGSSTYSVSKYSMGNVCTSNSQCTSSGYCCGTPDLVGTTTPAIVVATSTKAVNAITSAFASIITPTYYCVAGNAGKQSFSTGLTTTAPTTVYTTTYNPTCSNALFSAISFIAAFFSFMAFF